MSEHPMKDLDTAPRILMGPGPSMVPPRVLRAMATPLLGHLDPQFLEILEEEQKLLRAVFQTENELTISIQGTGSAGMEAALCNFIEPGDRVLVGVMGYFGERIGEMAARYGAIVERVEVPWGEALDPQLVANALDGGGYKLVALVHAETSTGALQTGIAEISEAAHTNGALLVLDTVTSLGGMPVEVDHWGVDVAYSASQKCLSAPPGLAPLTVSERAREVLSSRRTPVANWYLDLTGLEKYWFPPQVYHHTAPISTHYALREALRIVQEEGLDSRFTRHRENAGRFWTGLQDLGLPPLVPVERRLTTLITPQIPSGVDDQAVRSHLLSDYNLEISAGFGPLKGKVWRVGLMGFSSRKELVTLLLAALKELLS